MFDLRAAVIRIPEIIEAADVALPLAQRKRLLAETKTLIAGIDRHVEGLGGDEYALEKTFSVASHIGAALGLDETNGWGSQEHRQWATGDFWSLKDRLAAVA